MRKNGMKSLTSNSAFSGRHRSWRQRQYEDMQSRQFCWLRFSPTVPDALMTRKEPSEIQVQWLASSNNPFGVQYFFSHLSRSRKYWNAASSDIQVKTTEWSWSLSAGYFHPDLKLLQWEVRLLVYCQRCRILSRMFNVSCCRDDEKQNIDLKKGASTAVGMEPQVKGICRFLPNRQVHSQLRCFYHSVWDPKYPGPRTLAKRCAVGPKI